MEVLRRNEGNIESVNSLFKWNKEEESNEYRKLSNEQKENLEKEIKIWFAVEE